MKTPNVSCLFCNKKLYMPKNRLKTFKYCSRACKDKSNKVQIERNCAVCDKKFTHISSRCNKAKYCSRLCYHRSQKGKGSQEFTCATCNKKFMGSPSKRYRFCTTKCRGEFQRKPETYTHFTNLRKALKRRGLVEKCEMCGYDEIKEILGIHHIDENRKNNKRENLMIVCPNCHSILHRKHIPH